MVIRKTAELLAKQGWVRKPRLERGEKRRAGESGEYITVWRIEEVYVHSFYPMMLVIVSNTTTKGGDEIAGRVGADMQYFCVDSKGTLWGKGLYWDRIDIKSRSGTVKQMKEIISEYDAAEAYKERCG